MGLCSIAAAFFLDDCRPFKGGRDGPGEVEGDRGGVNGSSFLALGGEFGPNSKSRVAGFMSSGAVLMMPISFGWIEVPFGPGYGRSSLISSTLTSGLVSCIDMARLRCCR